MKISISKLSKITEVAAQPSTAPWLFAKLMKQINVNKEINIIFHNKKQTSRVTKTRLVTLNP